MSAVDEPAAVVDLDVQKGKGVMMVQEERVDLHGRGEVGIHLGYWEPLLLCAVPGRVRRLPVTSTVCLGRRPTCL